MARIPRTTITQAGLCACAGAPRWLATCTSPLSGEVEVDETYIGGKDRDRHKNKKSAQVRKAKGPQRLGEAVGFGKVGVIGAIERKGNVVARVIGSLDAPTLGALFGAQLMRKSRWSRQTRIQLTNLCAMGCRISPSSHARGEYVRGNVHTNSIESFWALLKRGIVGNYHNVSKKYLPFYLNEFSYRFNNRKNENMFADLITTCAQ